jgi:hypothetical protein
MVVTFNRSGRRFRVGDFAPVTRVARGQVFVQTPAGEQPLPLHSRNFTVSRPRPLEVGVGDRILIRANDRQRGLLNGEILTVHAITGTALHLADGRTLDTASFRDFTHGYAVTSHASQSKTVDHVIVAAERLDAKSAYVACSRGRHTCTVHTPDTAALLDRLPTGNRAAALDMLRQSRIRLETPTPSRSSLWARAQAHVEALRHAVGRAWDRGSDHVREAGRRALHGRHRPSLDARHQERHRQSQIDRS